MTPIKNTNSKIHAVIHIADIHIRLTKRHDEYTSVFNRLYESLDKASKLNSVLVIAGDIFHNKSDLSPECVNIGSNFLKNCANRIPTILIAGNHDATLANKSRLDCLTPIVEALNHPNLHYLKDSGLYRYENILFNNFSIFDDSEKYIRYKDIPSKYLNETDHHIVLFHGPVNNAVTDIGYTVSNRSITNDLFDGHHIVMLGDIHKHQILQEYDASNDKPVIAYASSMIQQNHGEDLKGHGFLMWDLKRRVFKHYELKNEYGYFTVEIKKGKLVTDISDIPKKARIRTKCFESIPSQVKEAMNDIKDKCEIIESTFIRVDEDEVNLTLQNGQVFDIHSILDVDYQNKLIEDNLLSKNTDKDLIEKVKELNKTINKAIAKDKSPKNIRWKPKTFEFDNMFSYGEGNYIDFTKLKGTIGLFAPNSSGKSSIMDALAFCVFDKFSRGFKASHVLNTQKMSFKCKFNFEVNGVDYYIEREGKSDKKGAVKVDVKFYKVDKDTEVPLNGEARRSTNDIIRDYVGTYEDFILTVLSIQNSKAGSFIDLGQTERKDLLCQFMGLNLFDQLYTIANDNFKETNALLKNTSKEQLMSELAVISDDIVTNNINIENYTNIVGQKELDKDQLNNKMLELSNAFIKTDTLTFDITKLEKEKIDLTGKIDKLNVNVSTEKIKLKTIDDNLVTLSSSLVDCNNVDKKYDEYKTWKQKESEKQKDIDTLKLVIKNKVEKLKKLEEHKYDPNCNYCVNNIFVKDAIKTKEDLELDKQKATKIVSEFNDIKENLDSYGDIEKQNKECINLYNEKLTLEHNKSSLKSSILQNENILINLQNKLKNVEDNIQTFYTNKEVIENNITILDNIEKLKFSIKSVENEIKDLNNKLFTSSGEKGKLELQYKNLTDQLCKVKELEENYESYKLYTNIISRDGIPYEIITKTLPEIEKEVNNILHQVVEFSITLQTDGKNIMTNIVYDDKKWPLELASGMERFISGLAIRVALINISNLPRPNIICIDEGWGTMDSMNLSSVGNMFSYLRQQFDFIWIISHLDTIKDSADILLEITKENGCSKIVYK